MSPTSALTSTAQCGAFRISLKSLLPSFDNAKLRRHTTRLQFFLIFQFEENRHILSKYRGSRRNKFFIKTRATIETIQKKWDHPHGRSHSYIIYVYLMLYVLRLLHKALLTVDDVKTRSSNLIHATTADVIDTVLSSLFSFYA